MLPNLLAMTKEENICISGKSKKRIKQRIEGEALGQGHQ
jgi:hypothetical protein